MTVDKPGLLGRVMRGLERAETWMTKLAREADAPEAARRLVGEPCWVIAAADEHMAVLVDVGRRRAGGKLQLGWSAVAWLHMRPAGYLVKLQLNEYDPAGRRLRTVQTRHIGDAGEAAVEDTPLQRFLAVTQGSVGQTVLDRALAGRGEGPGFADPMAARAAWLAAT